MTISYSGRFGALLFRWKASLWKSVWKELLIFLTLYYSISSIYRFTLREDQRIFFGKVAETLDVLTASSIPIYFLLGNYVVTIVKRWWEQFENIAWPDEFLLLVSAYIRDSSDPNARIIRRNIARYTIMSAILAWRNLSARVLKRFPTAQHLTKSGIMTESELRLYQSTEAPYGRWFLPIDWIQSILSDFRDQSKIDPSQYNRLLIELHAYRKKFIRLFICDWISIPLVYTQVATIATYGYFAVCLISRQQIDPSHAVKGHWVDVYVPFATIIQFLLYMGWLKVGERLMHPFGEEDDDFELNYIIDRHLYVGYMIVDEVHGSKPEDYSTSDPFLGEKPILPYTMASSRVMNHKPGSVQAPKLLFDEMELLHSHTSSKSSSNNLLNSIADTNIVRILHEQ